MNELKQMWIKFSSRIDALGMRERVMIFLMAVVVLIAIFDTTILSGEFAQETELSQQIARDQSEISGMQAEIRIKTDNYNLHPDAPKLAELKVLQQKSEQMRGQLQDMQKGLVSPDRMSTLLADLLKQNGKLRLVSLRTIPVSGLTDPEPGTKAEAEKTAEEKAGQKAVDDASKTGQKLADVKDAVPMIGPVVYKHGVELVIEGDYADIVNYMSALEAMPWQLFWGKARLTADDTPKRTLTLTLYTLSLDKKWLNI
jgi:MSHA biogenesis protein MshJ